MTILTLKDIGVTLGAPLFSDLSLTLNPGDRLGLVAANGRGKSTLLRIIAGEAEATTGDLTRSRGLCVGHLAQDIPETLMQLSFHAAVLDALSSDQAENESWRVDIVLDDLAVPGDLRDRPLAALSGGWRRMAMLARVWVTEPHCLLLDEPTNHLDLERISGLEAFLTGLPRTFPLIVASHDRAFLDHVTNRTLFLRPEASRDFALPYSAARVARDEADAAEARRFGNEMQKAAGLRRQAAKLKNIGINSGSDLLNTKTKQLSERAERIEAAARPAHREGSAGDIRLDATRSHARALVTLEDAGVATPDGRVLFRTGAKWIVPGDRVVLLGANGAGKSRVLALIAAAISSGGAEGVRISASVVPGICDQGLEGLSGADTPFDLIAGRYGQSDQTVRGFLAGAGIDIAAQDRPAGNLSGGQRARLAMLILRLIRPNLYLLDEPTNHLDIEGQEALERELMADDVSALIVSHDRAFVRATGTRFWRIGKGRMEEVEDPEAFFAGG
ncbi:ABC-F family ATP-binding cassette domain-containing protein [Defluviimonas aestuarii]|uniref:ABC-F family ATP-binding cassette domain-containing protein n=1 Tax=Albidovulum aestuarii TaxID=1130726 RepID=UPI00249CD479|nr:ABC-F family ATP-binding cassette domain-containing protein [Defluviimonas aestuarii]MDI3337005.1 ABC-F family ATP-binding cassette domain-containing protein [Defluviimonas aestuarii]